MFNMWSIGCIVRIVKMTLNNCMLITLVGYLSESMWHGRFRGF